MLFSNYEYFLKIVEEKSISKAAAKLFITQPALSKYIRRLESSLGFDLIDHKSPVFRLTYVGGQYLKYASSIARIEKQFENELSELQSDKSGRIFVGMSQWRSSFILPKVLPIISKQYPHMDISITEKKASELINDVTSGNLDFAILNEYSIPSASKLSRDILAEEKMLLVANANHPLVQEFLMNHPSFDSFKETPHFDIALLEHEPIYLIRFGQNISKIILDMFERHGLHPQSILEAENMVSSIYRVSTSMGFTFIPESGTYTNFLPSNTMLFTVDEPILSYPLAIIYRDIESLSPVAKVFLRVLKEIFSAPTT